MLSHNILRNTWSGCRESNSGLTHPKRVYCHCMTARSIFLFTGSRSTNHLIFYLCFALKNIKCSRPRLASASQPPLCSGRSGFRRPVALTRFARSGYWESKLTVSVPVAAIIARFTHIIARNGFDSTRRVSAKRCISSPTIPLRSIVGLLGVEPSVSCTPCMHVAATP